jgi:ribosomal protein S1
VSLAKEYGNIVGVEKFPSLTGFILTEHLVPKKDYKEGQKINCVVLDMDFEKEILDLSERLAEKGSEKNPGTVKVGHQYRATVELNKEDYLLLSFK